MDIFTFLYSCFISVFFVCTLLYVQDLTQGQFLSAFSFSYTGCGVMPKTLSFPYNLTIVERRKELMHKAIIYQVN